MNKIVYLNWKRFILIVIFAFGQLIIGCSGEEEASSWGPVGSQVALMNTAPEFLLKDLSGNHRNSKDYKGDIIILNFWATWCGICRIEIPDFNYLSKKYKQQGVQFVGISLDTSPRVVRKYTKEVPMHYDVLMGDRKISSDFGGITGLPTTFILDRQWRIRQIFPGYVKRSVIENEIKALLSSTQG